MDLFGSEGRKTIGQVDAQLVAKNTSGTRTGAVGFIDPVFHHVVQEILILFHGDYGNGTTAKIGNGRGFLSTSADLMLPVLKCLLSCTRSIPKSPYFYRRFYFLMENYLDQLNEAQQQAVLCTEGPVMIIAGAGSGKTRVLVYRIIHMVTRGIDPFSILALTFTNKAAKEMKNRIANAAGDEARNLWMGTFHSVFARLLRADAHRIGFQPNFTIYDTDDSKSLIREIVKSMGLDEKIYKPSMVYGRISYSKNNLWDFKAYRDHPELQQGDRSSGRPHLADIFEKYQKSLFRAGAMDFDDLLFNTFILLRDFPDVLNKYQDKFRYIMVDEFQDTNYAQYMIVRKLAARFQNICVVGDDAQSIYAFRGANIENILSFEKDYPELKTFRLEQNYRSTKTIVEAANGVIAHNKNRLRKEVWTHNNEGESIRLLKALSDNEEGNMVAQTIFEEKMNHQLKNADFAILYRTNAQSRSMEEAFRRKGIPYRIYGGISFYARKEVKDLLAYFRLAVNPNDDESVRRVINYPARGIGKTTLEKLMILAAEQDCSLWQVMEKNDRFSSGISTGTRVKIGEFVTMIRSFSAMLPTSPAFDLASHIAMSSGLLKELYADKSPEGVSQYENLQELLNGIKEFTDGGETGLPAPATESLEPGKVRTLDLFLQDIALLTDADSDKDGDHDRVVLMTVHAAKGLEFKHVFVVGMEENLFPSQMSLQSRADLEEERRLFYVAITRTERKLTLSYAATRYRWGTLIGCEPSRFLSEIDPKYMSDHTHRIVRNAGRERDGWIDSPKKSSEQAPPYTTRGSNFKKLSSVKTTTTRINDEPFEADDPSGIEVGMEVEHQKFGTGTVMLLEGRAPDFKATVAFPGHGNKHLLLKYAKLKIVK